MIDEILISIVFIHLFLLVIYIFMPKLEQKTTFFGVTIPFDKKTTVEFEEIFKVYRRNLLIFGLILLVLIIITYLFIIKTEFTALIDIITLLILIFTLYGSARKKVKNLKTTDESNETSSNIVYAEISSYKINRISIYFFSIPIIIMLATIFITITYVQTEISFEIMKIPFIQLLLILIFLFVYYSFSKTKKILDPKEKELSRIRNEVFINRWCTYSIVTSTIIVLLNGIMQYHELTRNISSSVYAIISAFFVIFILIYTVIIAFTTGQGGSRVRLKPTSEDEITIQDDDKYWKGGIIYFNKNDPSIFVQKRYGIGNTLNFGNKTAWIIIITIILIITLFEIII